MNRRLIRWRNRALYLAPFAAPFLAVLAFGFVFFVTLGSHNGH